MKIKDINVCARLAKERKRLKLTQREIADICDVSTKTVGRWERNVAIPSDKLALLIPLKYDITYILTSVKFEIPDSNLSENIGNEQNRSASEISEKLSSEQRMWLNIIESLSSDDASQIKEFGMALIGYSQARSST